MREEWGLPMQQAWPRGLFFFVVFFFIFYFIFIYIFFACCLSADGFFLSERPEQAASPERAPTNSLTLRYFKPIDCHQFFFFILFFLFFFAQFWTRYNYYLTKNKIGREWYMEINEEKCYEEKNILA